VRCVKMRGQCPPLPDDLGGLFVACVDDWAVVAGVKVREGPPRGWL
jgi:hypothetical protein